LEVEEVHTFYGLSHILFGLSLSVRDRELVCLLGRNGAGKTTTLKSIMGLVPPKSGRVVFHDQNLVGSRPYQACRQGIGYVPADRRVYQDLTVRKNLEVGQFFQKAGSAWTIDRIYEIFPHLKNIDGRMAGYLSGGERQMLTIARALMGGPKMLLLDEPTEGLAPAVVTMLEEQIRILKQEGTSILLAEQNIKSALSVSDRCYVINKGEIVYSGTVDELRESEEAVNHLTV
jgi:branched-chain amino acid transport system ATP-binding protein